MKRGFIPFTTAGFMILVLVSALVAHASWSRHQLTLGSIEDSASAGSTTLVAGVQNDIQHLARHAVYRTLWEVGERASEYSEEDRVHEIERLAGEYLAGYLAALSEAYGHLNARVGLQLGPNPHPSFELRQAPGGYVVARVELQGECKVTFSSPDEGLKIDLPYRSFEVWIDSRYFLLQGLMDRFIEKLGDVRSNWRWAEYAAAWGEAYLGGRVRLSESRSKALFELAWAEQELETFGSSDYLATSDGLSKMGSDALSGLFEVEVKPLEPTDVQTMAGFINRGLEALQEAEAELVDASECVEHPANHPAGGNYESESLLQKLEDCITHIDRVWTRVEEANRHFEQFLEFVGSTNRWQLNEGLTRSTGSYPGLEQMISLGVKGTEDKLLELKNLVNSHMLDGESAESSLEELHEQVNLSVDNLIAERATKAWIEHEEYPGPDEYDPKVEPEVNIRKIGICVTERSDGSIWTLKTIFKNVRAGLEKMEEIAELIPSSGEASVDGRLENRLIEALNSKPKFTDFSREELYGIFPPKPIESQPGVSVFHDFSIKRVKHERQDPAGWFSSSEPTPIPLRFIGLTLYWAQWEVSLELEKGAIEHIFDFDNPTIPRPLREGYPGFIHKPLGYRSEMPRNRFDFTLVLISPRYFSIDGG